MGRIFHNYLSTEIIKITNTIRVVVDKLFRITLLNLTSLACYIFLNILISHLWKAAIWRGLIMLTGHNEARILIFRH